MRTAKTRVRLGGCPGWSESSLGTQSFVGFCHEVAYMLKSLLTALSCTMLTVKTLSASHCRCTKHVHGETEWSEDLPTELSGPVPPMNIKFHSIGMNAANPVQMAVFICWFDQCIQVNVRIGLGKITRSVNMAIWDLSSNRQQLGSMANTFFVSLAAFDNEIR